MMALLSDLYQISSIETSPTNHQNHIDQSQGQQLVHPIDPTSQQNYSNDTLNSTATTLTLHSPENDIKHSVILTTAATTTATNTTTTTNNNDKDHGPSNNNNIRTRMGIKKQKAQRVGPTATRFKWTKEMMQVAMNLLKYGCKPKLVSVAVGCSIRTAQKFAETVTPREEGQLFKEYEVKRRGRKHKDTNPRLEAIRDVLNKDCTKTQVEIAANLKVSNTTVCRDLKKIGSTWRDKNKSSTASSTVECSGR